MIDEKSLNAICDRAGISLEDYRGAVDSQENVTLELPDVKVFKSDEFEKFKNDFKTNVLKENQGLYENAKKVGVEKWVAAKKEELGFTYTDEGSKNPDRLLDEYKAHISKELGKEPNKKITELEADLETLRGNLKAKETEYQSQVDTLNGQLTNVKTTNMIANSLPKDLPGGLTTEDAVRVFKGYYDIKIEDGKTIFYRDGVKQVDETLNPLTKDKVIDSFITEKGWTGGSGGRGAGNQGGGGSGFKTMNDVFAYMEKNNIDPNSAQGEKLQSEFDSN